MTRARVAGATYYGGLALVMAAIFLQLLDVALPRALAEPIGFNSEGFLLALLFAAWIQFARPRLVGRRLEWPVVAAVALACLALAVHLLGSEYPSRFKTLNESFLAAAVVVIYLHLPRPLPRAVPGGIAAGVLALMVFGQGNGVVTNLAEALAVLLLLPVGLDVVDRAILEPGRRDSTGLRIAWYATLVAVPVTASAMFATSAWDPAAGVVHYTTRLHEAFIAMLLVELYLAAALPLYGLTGPAREADGAREPVTVRANTSQN